MAEINAFRGLRYNVARVGCDQSAVVAPPYDVLTEEDKQALLKQAAENVVAVDLPHMPPKEAGPDEVYARSAEQLEQWQQQEVLVTEPQPAIYVYHQTYTVGGKTYTRKKFFARMRLQEFGKGLVFPHEQTFGGPKEDRLKLMKATGCQLSAVFGLYSDPDNAVAATLDRGQAAPDVTAGMQDVQNSMWVITDPAVIDAVCRQMADKPVYIADGHHRYGTALMYRDSLGAIPADHPANFILVGLCAMEDPGALILPTHRIISAYGSSPDLVIKALQSGLDMEPIAATPDDFDTVLPQDSPDDLVIYVAAQNQMFRARFANRDILKELAPDRSEAWRNLDLAYLHAYLFEELIGKNFLDGQPPKVYYARSGLDALRIVNDTNGIAFICKACTMDDLRAVSQAGDLMPQKSTFFYPKLATGLVINPLK